MMQTGLILENSDEIGFVTNCLLSQAINITELNQWAVSMIQNNDIDDLPFYIIDLVDFSGFPGEVYSVIGFAPIWNASDEQELALYGIVAKRGIVPYDPEVTDKAALDVLSKHPEIEKRFRETFPFIDL
ncbi:hypothetical protein [Serratia fonticola]